LHVGQLFLLFCPGSAIPLTDLFFALAHAFKLFLHRLQFERDGAQLRLQVGHAAFDALRAFFRTLCTRPTLLDLLL
jgi:hypothetical protein